MSEPDQQLVKRRLAGEGRPPPEIGRMVPETALKLACARACEEAIELEVMAKSVKMRRTVVSSLIDELPENALISLLQGPRNRLALAVFDGQMLAAVIEKQTTGRVVPTPAADRAPTRTDAVMMIDLINEILSTFQAEGEEAALPLTPIWSGFEYALPLEGARAIQMALEDIPYRLFDVHLDLEKGAKEGRVLLVFPFDPPRSSAQRPAGEGEEDIGALADVVQDTQTQMEAVLHRTEMPLSQVTGLTVGSLIPIPAETIMQIQIEDCLGERISFGSLGAQSGHRAVRINLSAPDALSHPVDLTKASNPTEGAVAGAPLMSAAVVSPPESVGIPPSGAMGEEMSAMSAELPELPPLEGLGDFPAMSDLPPLGGGEEMPDLADLGALGTMD